VHKVLSDDFCDFIESRACKGGAVLDGNYGVSGVGTEDSLSKAERFQAQALVYQYPAFGHQRHHAPFPLLRHFSN
jgi:hypothetical protein